MFQFCHKALVNVTGSKVLIGTFDFAIKLKNSHPEMLKSFADFLMTVLLIALWIYIFQFYVTLTSHQQKSGAPSRISAYNVWRFLDSEVSCFLSSPIACVACERPELLKTEITGGRRRFCCASKLFEVPMVCTTAKDLQTIL